ncbi:MAG: DUF2937 family protein [Rhodospirillaceae bacterium]|nr:DUF2937 family protein [Rhodospirillaceae bacterium]
MLELLDRFLAGACIAVASLIASQVHPFAEQYTARSAAMLAQAEAKLEDVQTGLRYQTMSDVARGDLEAAAKEALAKAARIHAAVTETSIFFRPFALVRSGDAALSDETWSHYVPALPSSPQSITYLLLGMVIGLILYELIRFPAVLLFQEPRRRRFKKRGVLG